MLDFPMTAVRNILIADDDAELRSALAEQLALHEEFSASQADTAARAIAMTRAAKPDLLIMDVGLPDMDGREAIKLMRKDGFKKPIIMLTGQVSDADAVLGLDAGANDYVCKPFRFAVLLARIRAHLRHHDSSDDATFQIGPYEFRPSSKLLLDPKGTKLRLTEKETAILRFLYRAEGRIVTRETLLRDVWGYKRQRHDPYA